MSVAARCDETERPGAARTWWTTGQRSTCISNSRRLHNYTQLAPPSYYNRLGQNGTAFQIVGSLSEAVSSHSMWGVPPCKSLLHAPVSARLSAARPAELSYDHGRRAAGHSGGSALSLGKPARHATLSSIPPTSKHSLVIHGALAVVVLIVQSSSSGRLRPAEERCDRTVWPLSGPPRVATCRPALATARTVWQWHSGGEREERATEGHSVATLHIHTTGHWPQLLSHFTAPAHPPCSARSRPGTVGVICVRQTVTDCCCASRIDRACIRFFKLRAPARARHARAGAPAPPPCGGRAAVRIECVTGPRARTDVAHDRTCEARRCRN